MSMILVLTSVSDRNAGKIFAEPPLIWRLLAPDDPEAYLQEIAKRKPRSFLDRLFGRWGQSKVKNLPTLELTEWEGVSQDLDKAWHGIHYLLTMSEWEGDPPLNFLLKGGRAVPGIDVGYGMARIFSTQEVRSIHTAIAAIDDEFLRGRFDPAKMTELEIYPQIWDRDPSEDDTLEYCLEYSQTLKQFLSDSVKNDMGMVVSIQ